MRHTFVIAGVEHEAWLSRRDGNYLLHSGDRMVPVALSGKAGIMATLSVGDVLSTILVAVDGDVIHVHADGATHTIRYVDPVSRYGGHSGASADDVAEAPMPGVVIAVNVTQGRQVAAGDTLMVIESMKLETAIKAWRDGEIAAVHVNVGQTFQRGVPLLTMVAEMEA